MAEMSKDIQITVSTDPDSLEKLKKIFADIGLALTQTYEQGFKPTIESLGNALPKPKPDLITAEMIAHAYGVPPDLIGLLPPDAGETIAQAAFDGTLTGEAYVYADGGVLEDWTPPWVLDQAIHAGDDTGVLPMGECPANTAPYVSGQLGINSYLVAQQPSGWQSKSSAVILAEILAAAKSYGAPVPKKTFPAKEPDPDSPTAGIPAHAIFTSPLIHSPEAAVQKGKDLLAQHGVKLTGPVNVKQLDEQGNPTGKWITLGEVGDFNLEPLLDFPATHDWEPPKPLEPQTLTLNYLINDLNPPMEPSLAQALNNEQLKMQAQAEKQTLGKFIGVDLGPESGNTVTVQTNPADPGVVQVSVYGPDGEPVKQGVLSQNDIEAITDQLPVMGTPTWNHDWQHPIGQVPLSNHASGLAMDYNVHSDHMHFELGHEKAFAEAVSQGEKVKKLQTKVFNVAGKAMPVVVTDDIGKVSQTYALPHGGTLIEYPDGVSTLDLPGTVQTPGAIWSHKLHGKFTLATPLARKIAGLDPDPHPQISMASTMLYAAGEACVWSHQHGWLLLSAVSTGPTEWFDQAGQPIEEDLFEIPPPPLIHPEAHLWCTACDVHWMNHKGDPVACDSGGYLRPSTPLEDKNFLIRIQMLKDTGLM